LQDTNWLNLCCVLVPVCFYHVLGAKGGENLFIIPDDECKLFKPCQYYSKMAVEKFVVQSLAHVQYIHSIIETHNCESSVVYIQLRMGENNVQNLISDKFMEFLKLQGFVHILGSLYFFYILVLVKQNFAGFKGFVQRDLLRVEKGLKQCALVNYITGKIFIIFI
jgi:hypothetical protein